MKIAVIGGGAAGFFAALVLGEKCPTHKVVIFERTNHLLSKVRISGGGRCNVTHACFDPKQLVSYYPRGMRELLGPFTHFQPQDTLEWFQRHGVSLHAEADGRMFPSTNSSQTIIDCFMNAATKYGVEIRKQQIIHSIERIQDKFVIQTDREEAFDKVILATGSTPLGHQLASHLGHSIVSPVPSLFSFNIENFPLIACAGIAIEKCKVSVPETSLASEGPLLITHTGFSGPAILKLSAWGARVFHDKKYHFELKINWLRQCEEQLLALKQHSNSSLASSALLPKRLWLALLERYGFVGSKLLQEHTRGDLVRLATYLQNDIFSVTGKSTHKEEFVTCGGVTLKEVNFKTMESRICPGLYFAGEILDIDGVTGGFNFQNAWTTAWLVAGGIGG